MELGWVFFPLKNLEIARTSVADHWDRTIRQEPLSVNLVTQVGLISCPMKYNQDLKFEILVFNQ